MSNIYIQEPPTSGKVLLTTSCGEIDMELWAKETPKACRNFIQLCMEGYYDNTIFHRIVKGFCIQGGDPTGTGSGGESIYGHPFKDEVHQRLRFARRGLVAMANAGPNDNQSQFFFTLDRADELNKKHTIFGKVTGNTIYNMLKMENCEVDKDDRPLFPPKIIRTEILSSPFDDIEPRENKKTVEEKSAVEAKAPKSKGTKNFQLLSFGEEAEDDETNVVGANKSMKMKSSHDLLDDPKLSSQPAVEQTESKNEERTKSRKRESDEQSDDDDGDDSDKDYDERMREQVRQKLKKQKADNTDVPDDSETSKRSDRSKELRKESNKLKRDLMESKRINEEEEEKEQRKHTKSQEASDSSEVLTDFHGEQKLYLAKKKKEQRRKGDGRDAQTISLLADFQSKLEQFAPEQESEEMKEAADEELDEDDDTGWMSHILSCEEARARQAKDASIQDADTYEIFDPRNPINKRRREASKQNMKTKRR